MSKGITIQINVPEEIEELIPRFAEFLSRFDGSLPSAADENLSDEILTGKDVCRDFKMNQTKLYALTMQKGPGSIPRFKIGRELRFRRSELIEWFNAQKVI